MNFIADMHISPLTVEALRKAGYAIIRVTEKLPATSSDKEIVQLAYQEKAVGAKSMSHCCLDTPATS